MARLNIATGIAGNFGYSFCKVKPAADTLVGVVIDTFISLIFSALYDAEYSVRKILSVSRSPGLVKYYFK